jgi:hypothetical protein
MLRIRFRVVFILLILILLAASILFGLLTYGLDTEMPPDPAPDDGGEAPAEQSFSGQPLRRLGGGSISVEIQHQARLSLRAKALLPKRSNLRLGQEGA